MTSFVSHQSSLFLGKPAPIAIKQFSFQSSESWNFCCGWFISVHGRHVMSIRPSLLSIATSLQLSCHHSYNLLTSMKEKTEPEMLPSAAIIATSPIPSANLPKSSLGKLAFLLSIGCSRQSWWDLLEVFLASLRILPAEGGFGEAGRVSYPLRDSGRWRKVCMLGTVFLPMLETYRMPL